MSYNRPPPPPGYPPHGNPYPPYPQQPGPPPSGPQGGYYPPGPGGSGGHYYNGPPQGPHQGYPPHGSHPPPPPGGPGAPGPYGHPPPAGPYGGPPQFYPSFGYIPNQIAQGDYRPQADALRKAMKGFGTDEVALIRILAHLDPLQMAAVRQAYTHHIQRDLYKDIKSETSGHFEQGLLGIIEGPLMYDVELVHHAVKGFNTQEWVLNDVLLGRSNADLREIKNAYHHKYSHSLQKTVEDDLSGQTKHLFAQVISATRHEESVPINHAAIELAVKSIHSATAGRMINDVAEVRTIFVQSSDNELRAINHVFHQHYNIELEKYIAKEFSGHMKAALMQMLHTATDPAYRDAAALEECMAGAGTSDHKLVTRIVRLHWNKQHLDQVKRAYHHHFKRDLRERVRGETSGDYQRLMLALLE